MIQKYCSTIIALLTLAGPAAAQQLRTFDLEWSGDTPFLRSLAKHSLDVNGLGKDAMGRSYVSKASAKAVVTMDVSKLDADSGQIPSEAIVSFEMVISGASTGSGYFYEDEIKGMVLAGVAGLDLDNELVGQALAGGGSWGGLEDINNMVPSGDFGVEAVEGSLAPVPTEFPLVLRTGGAGNSPSVRYRYLQLVSFKPAAEAVADENTAESE